MLCCVVQMNSKKDVDANLNEAEQLISQASDRGVRLLVLPEMFACLGVTNQYEMSVTRFTEQGVLGLLAKWSQKYGLYIVAGSMPMSTGKQANKAQKVHAACLVFSPEGEQIASYNKIHLFDVDVADEKGSYKESDTFLAGDSPKVVKVDDINLGLSICYDLRFPELFQKYMAAGCEIITVPSAFTYQTGKAHWEILLKARAIETQSFILAANQVGVHEDGRRTWGQSMIIGPNGDVLAEVEGDKPGLAIADIELKHLIERRKFMPLLQHKRLI